jgi:hypothetical protein
MVNGENLYDVFKRHDWSTKISMCVESPTVLLGEMVRLVRTYTPALDYTAGRYTLGVRETTHKNPTFLQSIHAALSVLRAGGGSLESERESEPERCRNPAPMYEV